MVALTTTQSAVQATSPVCQAPHTHLRPNTHAAGGDFGLAYSASSVTAQSETKEPTPGCLASTWHDGLQLHRTTVLPDMDIFAAAEIGAAAGTLGSACAENANGMKNPPSIDPSRSVVSDDETMLAEGANETLGGTDVVS